MLSNLISGWSPAATLSLCSAVAIAGTTQSTHAVNVAVELSLVVDVSYSVDATEYNLMRDGQAAAFSNPLVMGLIATAPGGIAVNVIQFSSSAVEVISWTHLQTVADSLAFSSTLSAMSRQSSDSVGFFTDIAEAVDLADSLIGTNGFEGVDSIIDLAGDGSDNSGGSITAARDNALAGNADMINGLAIISDEADLASYFTDNLIGGTASDGTDSFVVTAADFSSFENALVQKLETELTIPEPSGVLFILCGSLSLFIWRRRPAA